MNIRFIYNSLNEGVFGSYKNIAKADKKDAVKRESVKIFRETALGLVKEEVVKIMRMILDNESKTHEMTDYEIFLRETLHEVKVYIDSDSGGDKLIVAIPGYDTTTDVQDIFLDLNPEVNEHMITYKETMERYLQEYLSNNEYFQKLRLYKIEFKIYLYKDAINSNYSNIQDTGERVYKIEIKDGYTLDMWREFKNIFIDEKFRTKFLYILDAQLGDDYSDLVEVLKQIEFDEISIILIKPTNSLKTLISSIPPNKEVVIRNDDWIRNDTNEGGHEIIITDSLIRELTGYPNSLELFNDVAEQNKMMYSPETREYLSKCKTLVIKRIGFTTTGNIGSVKDIDLYIDKSLSR